MSHPPNLTGNCCEFGLLLFGQPVALRQLVIVYETPLVATSVVGAVGRGVVLSLTVVSV